MNFVTEGGNMEESSSSSPNTSNQDDEEQVLQCSRCFQLFSIPSNVFKSRELDLCVACFRKSPALVLHNQQNNGPFMLHCKPDHIDGKIYLGGYRCAKTRSVLDELKITRIIVCGNDLVQYFAEPTPFDDEKSGKMLSPLEYLQFALEDEYEQTISQCFDDAHNFIENSSGNVLIHCHAGVSRSATIVLSYLMKYKKMTFPEARDFVKARRRCICPNPGFAKQLHQYQKQLEECGILPQCKDGNSL